MIGPEFAHDEVRRYAVARLLLADGAPTSRIMRAGAPRWSLAATRLACQESLAEPDTPTTPLRGRFAALQASFDALVDTGHGARWGDVPGEALVTLTNPGAVLRDAWPNCLPMTPLACDGLPAWSISGSATTTASSTSSPLSRSSRCCSKTTPHGGPASTPEICSEPGCADTSLRILPLVIGGASCFASVSLRRVQQRIVASPRSGRPQLPRAPRELRRRSSRSAGSWRATVDSSRRSATAADTADSDPRLPTRSQTRSFLNCSALLGPDLGTDGEAILRRVAQDAPWEIAPAVEEFLTGRALANYRRGLLAQLTEAYYLDDEADGSSVSVGDPPALPGRHPEFDSTGVEWGNSPA